MTATIEPGVVCDQLRAAAADIGLTYGPDPSTHSRCTVGGMVANNACGSHSVVWGTSADNLVSVTVMLADGREIELRKGGTSDGRITNELQGIKDRNLALLRTELGRFPRQVSGYGLHYLLDENGFDAAKAFAGTEGTCGIITRLTVRLVRKPVHTALAVLGFEDAIEAATAAPKLRVSGVYTIEGMGADLIDALQTRPGQETAGSQLPSGGGWLYCEVGADTVEEAQSRALELTQSVAERLVDSVIVPEGPQARALWRIREAGAGIATRLPDGGEAWPGWEDSAVPPAQLGDYLRDLYALMDKYEFTGIPFGHFGEGCVHLRISFDLVSPDGVEKYRSFIQAAAELVSRYGGSASGEHGDGRARSELLSTIYSPQALRAFAEFKRVFDPDGLFNPGVLVDPEPLDQGIRPGPGARTFDITPIHAFTRDNGSFANAVNRCVGVGACRSDTGAMCPSFQATRDEVHSTRGRARALAEMLRGESVSEGWKSKETLEALDLCLSCKACASECPVNVDMATYKAEFLHRHYRSGLLSFLGPNRRPMAHFTMGWMPDLMQTLNKVPGPVRLLNWLESHRPIEELTKRLGGIEQRRRMITFAEQPLTTWHRRTRGRKGETADRRDTVVLWPDTFTNFSADAPGRAAIEVLEAMGYRVLMPMGNVCCGLTWHSTGQLDKAKSVLRRTLDVMEPLLAAGYPIIGLEPSCTGMLEHEITELLPDDPRAAQVTRLATTLGTFVADHLTKGKPWPFGTVSPDGSPTSALCQVHCHQQSGRGYGDELNVLTEVGVATDVIDSGCCGLAGNWGFEPGHYEVSQQVAERTLFPAVRAAGEETIVLADGFSCRTQIAQGTGKEGLHLAQILHAALRHDQPHQHGWSETTDTSGHRSRSNQFAGRGGL
ncbi:UNVERIFIED_ORG: FAD/FMN-containing dehydrogenase/Fe-S oxidoreductase [Arthrobacter globiformis]|nr:FAD/FMN-containing dehydrogenase/Fe-S oxidoreductase [Arthrobacter globiformis]